ncbi:MAG TPA: DUF4157 domain-containing protein [Thermoanaerobaculia bacterium]|nr:DUF4157 domain-containing protein [Thermoanaerobaculia bacterium]
MEQEKRDTAPRAVRDVLGTPGRPLDPPSRAYFESRFDHDFSRVRVHTDERAAQSANEIGAHAWTVGNDIAFARGMESPRVLEHELSHVVQQSDVPRHAPIEAGHPGDAFERDAENPQPRLRASTPRLQGLWPLLLAIGGGLVALGLSVWGLWRQLSDSFSKSTLEAYLKGLRSRKKIEGEWRSDNKARACAAREQELGPYSVDDRALLIEEMLDGRVLSADEGGILATLRAARPGEPALIVARVGRNRLLAKFDGRNRRVLDAITLTAADAGDALVTRLRDLSADEIQDYVSNATDPSVRASAMKAASLQKITAPVPVGATVARGGEATFAINGIAVVARPDIRSNDPRFINDAFTSFGLQPADFGTFGTDAQDIVRQFVPPRVEAVIQTTWGPGARPELDAKYGRGTTDEDKYESNTTFRFHESRHGEDWFEFLRQNPPPVFTGAVGMTKADYQRAIDAWGTEITAYNRRAVEFSIRRSDCVGTRPPDAHFDLEGATATICRQVGGAPSI